jgi:hypothetical protein
LILSKIKAPTIILHYKQPLCVVKSFFEFDSSPLFRLTRLGLPDGLAADRTR